MWYLYEESKFVNCFQAIVEGIALVDAKKFGGGEIGRYKAPWGRKRKRGVRVCELQGAFEGVAGSSVVGGVCINCCRE